MTLKYFLKSLYFSTLEQTYTDYGAWSEMVSGAGGLPSEESIELFLDFLRSNDIEIIDSEYRAPVVHLYHLNDKYSKRNNLNAFRIIY